jgi:hypothetical protein
MDSTLAAIETALEEFHIYKHVFICLGICKHFNIPKIHSLQHYIVMIRLLGAADGYNTEASEWLHIDYAKEVYQATNHKDYVKQMTAWLQQQEAVKQFSAYLDWQLGLTNSSWSEKECEGVDNEEQEMIDTTAVVVRSKTRCNGGVPPGQSPRLTY